MIQVENLTKKFDDFTALDHMHCCIPEGCIYGMVGSNGAGKSTFLRLITGIYRPDQGSILIDGEPVYENVKIKEKISFVPDDLYFMNGVSMNRMAHLYAAIHSEFDWNRFQYLTKTFGLNPEKSTNTFSKGMRRQAAIILALSCRPKYMFFDETFDGLDPVMRNLVKTLICKDVLENQATAIITSHSLRELEDTCDQLALLHQGGVVLENDIQNLKTSLFKIQVAFSDFYDSSLFEGIPYLHYGKRGSVATLIIRGDKEEISEKIRQKNPILLDILPLTLEEVFTYELEALGYHFDVTGYDFEEKGGEKSEK
ncbi:MAG: ABC transporter ATP-binding protein [Clostridiales bacterium]|nr:ABC transporter ATP-binding protein [Clostridiales bacterium]